MPSYFNEGAEQVKVACTSCIYVGMFICLYRHLFWAKTGRKQRIG